MPFQEAIDKLGAKTIVTSTLNSQEWSDVPVGLRDRAFFSATIENARFLQSAKDSIADFLANSRDEKGMLVTGSRAEFVRQLSDFALKSGMGPLDPDDAGTLKDITSQTRLSLIFNTQVQAAEDYGYWKQGMDPDLLDEFPAQRFIRVMDVKQPRIIHAQNENVVRLKTDLPFWLGLNSPAIGGFGVPWGPWGFNSGMGVEDVDRTEAEATHLIAPGQKLQPVEKDLNDHLEASTTGLDDDIVNQLKAAFGDQVEFDEETETIRWTGNVPEETSSPGELAPSPKPSTTPVSDAIDIQVKGLLKAQIQNALDAIDEVHDDGTLPEVPVRSTTMNAYGYMRPKNSPFGRTVDELAVRKTGPWPELTTVHEIGHMLDLEVIGAKGSFATESLNPVIKEVLEVAKGSDSINELKTLLAGATSQRKIDYYGYLLGDAEIWARAYAQFIAEESSSLILKSQLERAIESDPFRQWTKTDFAPISAAIKKMFSTLGWL